MKSYLPIVLACLVIILVASLHIRVMDQQRQLLRLCDVIATMQKTEANLTGVAEMHTADIQAITKIIENQNHEIDWVKSNHGRMFNLLAQRLSPGGWVITTNDAGSEVMIPWREWQTNH